jgi:hypothetical protein
VREMTRLTYDPQDALTWAIEHRLALSLDVKAFDQLARVTTLPFVTYWIDPQATLSPCLPGQPSPPTPLQEAPSQVASCTNPESMTTRTDS